MRELQHELVSLVARGIDAQPPVIGDVTAFLRSLATAWQAGEVRPTHRQKAATARWWRTRADPFAQSWPMLETWLAKDPHLTAKDLMARLSSELPDLYPTGAQLRTLQRRLQTWRSEKAKELILGVMNDRPSDGADPREVSEMTTTFG